MLLMAGWFGVVLAMGDSEMSRRPGVAGEMKGGC
jgi:hypothetical protein